MEVAGGPLELVAADGFRLAALHYRPAAPNRRAVQIHAAAGVPQEYYADFAAFLAGRGFHAVTFDYRGVGRSVPAHVRHIDARMQDWALLDAPAVLSFVESLRCERQLVVGHSFGGQSVAVMPGNERVDGLLAVASQSVYYGHWSGRRKAGLWLFTRAFLPVATRIAGYFPGELFPEGENLPAGVALEWARWVHHPRYLVGALGLEARAAAFRAPLHLMAMADDYIFAPRRAAEALLDLYPNARKEFSWIEPRAAGAERIGHFGFFRARFRNTLWQRAAAWLESV